MLYSKNQIDKLNGTIKTRFSLQKGNLSGLKQTLMEIETELSCLDDDLKSVLFIGTEYTQPGSVVSNCILLFGSNEGDCTSCTKPCLHPLATADLQAFFSVLLFFCLTR